MVGRSRTPSPHDLNISYDSRTNIAIALNWSMVEHCDGYIIKRRKRFGNDTFINVKHLGDRTITNFEDTSFTRGIEYYYMVASLDRAGESGASNQVSVFPRSPPPEDLIASYDECTGNSIKLQWKPVPHCRGYVVRRGTTCSNDEQLPIKH